MLAPTNRWSEGNTMSDANQTAATEAAEEISSSIQEAAPEAQPIEVKAEAAVQKAEAGQPLTKEEKKLVKEYKLQVNGSEKVVKFDPHNDEEVRTHLQKVEASESKFKEAAEIRKAAMQFIQDLKTNPKRVLSDPNIGVDLKKFAEDIMQEQITEMEKSPEQREREKLQRELEALRKEREDEHKANSQKEFQRLQENYERQLTEGISAALDIGGLPKTERTVRAMADYMMIAAQHKIDLSPQDIVPLLKNSTVSEFKDIVNSLGDDQLEDFLGKEIIGRLRKKNVARAKAAVQTSSAVKPTGTETKKPVEEKAQKKMLIRDFLRM